MFQFPKPRLWRFSSVVNNRVFSTVVNSLCLCLDITLCVCLSITKTKWVYLNSTTSKLLHFIIQLDFGLKAFKSFSLSTSQTLSVCGCSFSWHTKQISVRSSGSSEDFLILLSSLSSSSSFAHVCGCSLVQQCAAEPQVSLHSVQHGWAVLESNIIP